MMDKEMMDKEMIENIVNYCIEEKESYKRDIRRHQHSLDDAKEDGNDFRVELETKWIKEDKEKIHVLETIMDIMCGLSDTTETKKFYTVTKRSFRDQYMDGTIWDTSITYNCSTFEIAKNKFDSLREKAIAKANKDTRDFVTDGQVYDSTMIFTLDYIEKWDNEGAVITLKEEIMDQFDKEEEEEDDEM